MSLSALDRALKAKDAERALDIADDLKYVPLRYELRLTLLLADKEHPRYEPAALDLLAQTIGERKLPLIQVKKLADALAHVHHYYYGYWARLALQDVLSQLYRRGGRVEAAFDSLQEEHRFRGP